MNERHRRSIRRCGVWVVALTGHALLYLLLVRNAGPPVRQGAFTAEQAILLMLDLSRPPEEGLPAPPEPARNARLSIPRPAEHANERSAPNTAITAPAPEPAAPVDWANEARVAARAATDGSGEPTTRLFGEPLKPALRKCEKRASSFEWNPEPKKAGFIGILPYVRLGKRCIVGLGFFGCALGALPEPNSHLFDDMSDPGHITTSVPGVDRCD
ncbi:MAG TPA: hypothetical protein VGO41_05910 [Steroidobacteraceae bacterium]|jgi:hypothetical protein|nr:hypothetical protein [Steroidobacteraceae bacterium]